MSVRVRMACGHEIRLTDGSAVPLCPACAEHRVASVKAPAGLAGELCVQA